MGLTRILGMMCLLAVFAITHHYYFERTIGDLQINSLLNKIAQEIDVNRLAVSEVHVKRIREEWEKKEKWVRLIIPLENINEITTDIALLEEVVNMRDKKLAKFQTVKLMDHWRDLKKFK